MFCLYSTRPDSKGIVRLDIGCSMDELNYCMERMEGCSCVYNVHERVAVSLIVFFNYCIIKHSEHFASLLASVHVWYMRGLQFLSLRRSKKYSVDPLSWGKIRELELVMNFGCKGSNFCDDNTIDWIYVSDWKLS